MDTYLIVTGGDLGDIDWLKENIPQKIKVVGVDSGIDGLKQLDLTPDWILGDMDSVLTDWKEYSCHQTLLSVEKDDTDTGFAIKQLVAEGAKDIVIFGGTGGRLDHTYANIQSMFWAFSQQINICLLHEENSLFFVDKNRPLILPKRKDTYFSVFSLSPFSTGVSINGGKYTLKNADLTDTYPLGVSNEWAEDKCQISVEEGCLLVIVCKK